MTFTARATPKSVSESSPPLQLFSCLLANDTKSRTNRCNITIGGRFGNSSGVGVLVAIVRFFCTLWRPFGLVHGHHTHSVVMPQ